MSWLSSLLLAAFISLGGTLLGGLVASGAAGWLAVSQREGYAGYWVVFWALVAGAYSFASALLVLRLARGEGAWLAILYGCAAAYGAIAAVGLVAWLSSDRPAQGADGGPIYEIEVRLPPDFPAAADSTRLYGYLSAKGAGMSAIEFDHGRLRRSPEAAILPGRVRLHTRRAGIYLALGGTSLDSATFYFHLPAFGAPGTAPGAWSDWIKGTPSGDLGSARSSAPPEVRLRPLPAAPDGR